MCVCVYVCMGACAYGCMGVWVYECMGVWVYVCMGVGVWAYVWVYDCMGVWCMDAWVSLGSAHDRPTERVMEEMQISTTEEQT